MYPSVTRVVPRDDYVLWVEFDNGETGSVDMKPMLDTGVFSKIKEREAFEKVHVAFDTVEWECGVDLDPEFVYSHRMRECID